MHELSCQRGTTINFSFSGHKLAFWAANPRNFRLTSRNHLSSVKKKICWRLGPFPDPLNRHLSWDTGFYTFLETGLVVVLLWSNIHDRIYRVTLSIFTVSCNHHHAPAAEHSHRSKRNPVPVKQLCPPMPHFSHPLATTNLPSSSADLTILDIYRTRILLDMTFCVWPLSLRVMFSGFNHAVVCIRTSCLFLVDYYSTGRIYNILITCSSVDGHLGCFPLLAVVTSAAVNISCTNSCFNTCFQFFWVSVPWSEIVGSYINSSYLHF